MEIENIDEKLEPIVLELMNDDNVCCGLLAYHENQLSQKDLFEIIAEVIVNIDNKLFTDSIELKRQNENLKKAIVMLEERLRNG